MDQDIDQVQRDHSAPGFRAADAWLLWSVKAAQRDGGAAELADILAAGDFINHAIFLDAELAAGFRRLHQGGFISIDHARCSVTAGFDDAWQAAGAGGIRSAHRQLDLIREMLGLTPGEVC